MLCFDTNPLHSGHAEACASAWVMSNAPFWGHAPFSDALVSVIFWWTRNKPQKKWRKSWFEHMLTLGCLLGSPNNKKIKPDNTMILIQFLSYFPKAPHVAWRKVRTPEAWKKAQLQLAMPSSDLTWSHGFSRPCFGWILDVGVHQYFCRIQYIPFFMFHKDSEICIHMCYSHRFWLFW